MAHHQSFGVQPKRSQIALNDKDIGCGGHLQQSPSETAFLRELTRRCRISTEVGRPNPG